MMNLKSFCLALFILLGFPLAAGAQGYILKGLILDASDGEPLPGAQVFLNQTTIGTVTNDLGSFSLKRIPEGLQTIIIRMLGYETFVIDIEFPNEDMSVIEASLQPEIMNLNEINIEDDRPKEWLRDLQYFKDQFLGYSSNSGQVEFENPEVLDFQSERSEFIATARKPLKLINHALGYRITYYLEEFSLKDNIIRSTGFSKYEELTTNDQDELDRWIENRKAAYLGSYRHFIESLTNNNIYEDGFRIYYTNRKLKFYASRYDEMILEEIKNPNHLYRPTRNIHEVEFFNRSGYPYIRVEYILERPDPMIADRYGLSSQINSQISWIEFPEGKAVIDLRNGNEMHPYRALLHGYWGWSSRIPDLLPGDFQ
ncbi:carboxypeptidase-like regulatory domain-containing protein [Balneola sp. MJW-20]|uniref:carboxypeptidase-like regulatory domain-containing protein n=1 Tax=Gracilimonas aurantiaca TaxID=3234185 RepID=UPI0034663390